MIGNLACILINKTEKSSEDQTETASSMFEHTIRVHTSTSQYGFKKYLVSCLDERARRFIWSFGKKKVRVAIMKAGD